MQPVLFSADATFERIVVLCDLRENVFLTNEIRDVRSEPFNVSRWEKFDEIGM